MLKVSAEDAALKMRAAPWKSGASAPRKEHQNSPGFSPWQVRKQRQTKYSATSIETT